MEDLAVVVTEHFLIQAIAYMIAGILAGLYLRKLTNAIKDLWAK